jgi:hypothetical protein
VAARDHACIVHQDVDLPEPSERFVHARLRRLRVGHVDAGGESSPAERRHLFRRQRSRLEVHVGDGDVGARSGQRQDDSPTDSPAPAGHDGDLLRQEAHLAFLPKLGPSPSSGIMYP